MSQLGRPTTFYRPSGAGTRNERERICLIVNPRAGAGSAGRRLDELQRAAERAFASFDLKLTEGPGHATQLAGEAIDGGAQIVAAVGGDGTCHEVVNGLVRDGRARSLRVAFTTIPFGTGSDLMKSLEIPRSLSGALWMAATGMTLPSDLGEAVVQTESGPITRLFVNVAGFGMNGEVVRRANDSDKRWGGRLTFLGATLRTSLEYRSPEVSLEWEGPEGPGSWSGPLLSCFLANGAFCGGGMWVGRGGSMQDGLLDLTILPDLGLVRQLAEARRLYDGSLDRFPGARRLRIHCLEARAVKTPAPPVDLDGESPGVLDARFRILPGALMIRGGWLKSLAREPAMNAGRGSR